MVGKRPLVSSANPKKLVMPQKTRKTKNAVKLANMNVDDVDLGSDGSTAIGQSAKANSNVLATQSSRESPALNSNGDKSFCAYIACEAEETLYATVHKRIAEDAEMQSARSL